VISLVINGGHAEDFSSVEEAKAALREWRVEQARRCRAKFGSVTVRGGDGYAIIECGATLWGSASLVGVRS